MNRPLQTQYQQGNDESIPATASGPGSGLGRRTAYEDVVKSQRNTFNDCNITLFGLMTTYSIDKLNIKLKKALDEPIMLMTLNEYGESRLSDSISNIAITNC